MILVKTISKMVKSSIFIHIEQRRLTSETQGGKQALRATHEEVLLRILSLVLKRYTESVAKYGTDTGMLT